MTEEKREITAGRILGLLSAKAMSYACLARKAGVTAEAARRYAIGERLPSGAILLNIAKALGTSADYLLGRTDEPFAAAGGEAIQASVPMGAADKLRLAEIISRHEELKEARG